MAETAVPGSTSPARVPFKEWIHPGLVRALAGDIRRAHPAFPARAFVREAEAPLSGLELKERVAWVADCLARHLPPDYPRALAILVQVLGPETPVDKGFAERHAVWPIAHFIEVHGLEHPEPSLEALHAVTRRFSAEFAIRPYLMRHPERTLAALRRWARDSNAHVRRLVSEGSRPRLPWGCRLPAFIRDPSPTLELLEALKDDGSEYVRRSVANHLNDIGKDHPERLVSVCEAWMRDAGPERKRLIRHALRGLVKAGHPGALKVLGAGPAKVELEGLAIRPRQVRIGGPFELRFALHGTARGEQELVVDYVLHLVRASGRRSPKVFKLCRCRLKGGATLQVRRTLCLKPVTVRRYYAGKHRLDIQVNGRVLGGVEFDLRA